MFVCAPFVYATVIVCQYSLWATWPLVFIAEVGLCLGWALFVDMQMYVVIPNRRATANAFNMFVSHLLGDAFSPYLIGAIADWYKGGRIGNVLQFLGLQYGCFVCPFVCVLSAGFFLFTSLYILEDRAIAEKLTTGKRPESLSGPPQTDVGPRSVNAPLA